MRYSALHDSLHSFSKVYSRFLTCRLWLVVCIRMKVLASFQHVWCPLLLLVICRGLSVSSHISRVCLRVFNCSKSNRRFIKCWSWRLVGDWLAIRVIYWPCAFEHFVIPLLGQDGGEFWVISRSSWHRAQTKCAAPLRENLLASQRIDEALHTVVISLTTTLVLASGNANPARMVAFLGGLLLIDELYCVFQTTDAA